MPDRSDMQILGAYGYEPFELSLAFLHRKVPVYKVLQPRGESPDRRPKWTYFSVIRYADSYAVLKGLTQSGIKAQIGRCLNGLTAHDCHVCESWRNADPIHKEGYCVLTISPELTGFYGCPRFEPRKW